MPVLVKSKIDVKQFPSIRAWRAAMTKAHDAQGQYWHQHHLKLHFRRDSGRRYGYKERTAKYRLRKERAGRGRGRPPAKYGGMVDLVWKGDLEAGIRSFATIRSFPSRVTVTMQGPSYLRINYRPGRPHLAREITAVVPEEVKQLEQILDARVTSEMNRSGDSRTITT
jgi:hypothetical protein